MKHTFETLIHFSSETLAAMVAELIANYSTGFNFDYEFRTESARQTYNLLLAAGLETETEDHFWNLVENATEQAAMQAA